MPFDTITGHRRLLALLARAVMRDTLPPALLFAGPAGVGKLRTALALAQALNCLEPTISSVKASVPAPGTKDRTSALQGASEGAPAFEHDSCGECNTCQRITRGVHPDVLVIKPDETGSIKIEQVRDAIDRANYRPFEGRWRVVVVDDADALTPGAQHALLKTLEEPPSTSVFVLVTSAADSLLSTVRSRCSRLRFGPLTDTEVVSVLMRDHSIEPRDAMIMTANADGSIGQALALESNDLMAARNAAQQLLEQAAGNSNPSRRIKAVQGLWGKRHKPAEERAQLASCLRATSSMLRDLSALASGAAIDSLANADLRSELEQLGQSYDSERSTRAFRVVDQALGALEHNASPKIVADWLAVRL